MHIVACVQWMTPFAMTLRDIRPRELQIFPHITTEDIHAIQTHSVDLNLLVCIMQVYILLFLNLKFS